MACSFDGSPVGERYALINDADDEAFERDAYRYAVLFAIAVTIVLTAIGLYEWRGTAPDRGSHVGEPAPLFTLPSFDGGSVRLEDYQGHPVVLNFWASWCAPCRDEAPVLEEVANASSANVVFIGVNVRDRDEDARAFLDKYDVAYPNARDVDGTVESLYAGVGIPVTIFISADGIIERTWIGALDEQKLLAYVAEIQ